MLGIRVRALIFPAVIAPKIIDFLSKCCFIILKEILQKEIRSFDYMTHNSVNSTTKLIMYRAKVRVRALTFSGKN